MPHATTPAEKIFARWMDEDDHPTLIELFGVDDHLSGLSAKRKHRLRTFLAIRQGYLCCYCRQTLTLEKPKADRQRPNYATFEHVHDAFDGGGKKDDRCSNIKIACYECNVKRGSSRNERALRYYSQFFAKKHTLMRFTAHPKVGWSGIIREFGPIPDHFE